MRPSDEHQATSTRPNLMSASRPSLGRPGEDSILAKLERDPARRQGARAPLRLFGYGAGAALAIALTATLAWLAADNGPAPAMLAQAAEPAESALSSPAPALVMVADSAPRSAGAALIDAPPPPPPP
ncbi:hypothetical protein KBW98_19440, partial [Massilia sp. ST3]|nr:hypothetical protein [Massilia sp. ST3]